MKIEKFSAWTEMISSLAVLGTLVYLVIQTNQNAEAIKANTRQQMLATDMEFLRDIFNDPSITTLQYKTDLNDDEKSKLAAQYTMFLRQRESNWIQYENGALDALTWESMKSTFNIIARQSNFQLYWTNLNRNHNTQMYAPEFVKIVDDIVAATPAGEQAEFIRVMERPGDKIAKSELNWINGCWRTADGATTERWQIGSDTHLFGNSVTSKDGKVVFFENMNMVKTETGYTFFAYPMGKGPSDFPSVATGENTITFENPEHDYPQRISYTRDGDILTGRISLADGSNPNQWTYKRCGS